MPRSAAILMASRTRSSESMRDATYSVDAGTSVRSASRTELRPATISVVARGRRPPVRPGPPERADPPADAGRPRALAAADAVRRANLLTDLLPPTGTTSPDLVFLARPWAASDPTAAGWSRAGVAHLVATVRGATGVVGPLVVPGVTSCLRCADLHRRDADPRWPQLAAQLTAADPPPSGATVTCLLTAATAAVQVLGYLDGTAAPAALDATLELTPPDLVPRVRRWTPHAECGCAQRADVSTGDNGR